MHRYVSYLNPHFFLLQTLHLSLSLFSLFPSLSFPFSPLHLFFSLLLTSVFQVNVGVLFVKLNGVAVNMENLLRAHGQYLPTVKLPNLEHATQIGTSFRPIKNNLILIVENFCMQK